MKKSKKSKTKKSQKSYGKTSKRSKRKKEYRKRERLEIFLEFFVFGLIMGVVEDLIAIRLSTGEPITWKIIGIIALVTLPFAAIGELFIDRIRLLPKNSKKNKGKKKK